jgi:hypothetical protein
MPALAKRKVRDLQRVRDMLSLNIPTWKIAKVLGIDDSTFRRNYRDVLDEANLKNGRKPFEPTDAQRKTVKLMAAVGVPQDDIAKHLDISPGTLREHFHDELKSGKLSADIAVAGNLYKAATGSTDSKTMVAAAIWWTKARMGWKDTSRIESTGADGGAIKTENSIQVFLPDNGRGDGPTPIAAPSDTPAIEHDAVAPLDRGDDWEGTEDE